MAKPLSAAETLIKQHTALPPAAFALDGVLPTIAVEPADQASLAGALKLVCESGLCAVPWGGGVRQEMGYLPQPYDVAISTRALSRLVDVEPGDLTITVEAGMTLASMQRTLAQHGQFVALESPAPDRETIGGILSAASAGILRFGYGSPRDQLIGLAVAMADGSVVRGGGRVVKNVAGYDLCKLFTGSFGTLGVIVEATFRVRPLPLSTRTWVGGFPSALKAEEALGRLMDSDLQPSFLQALDPDLSTAAGRESGSVGPDGTWMIALGADGDEALSLWMAEEAHRLGAPEISRTVIGDESARIRQWLLDWTAPQTELCLRVSVSSDRVFPVMAAAREELNLPAGLEMQSMASAANGVIYFHCRAQESGQDAALARAQGWVATRAAEEHGSCVVLRSPSNLRSGLEMWGPPQPTEPLMRRIRSRFDPALCLNRGRLFRNERSLSINPGAGV